MNVILLVLIKQYKRTKNVYLIIHLVQILCIQQMVMLLDKYVQMRPNIIILWKMEQRKHQMDVKTHMLIRNLIQLQQNVYKVVHIIMLKIQKKERYFYVMIMKMEEEMKKNVKYINKKKQLKNKNKFNINVQIHVHNKIKLLIMDYVLVNVQKKLNIYKVDFVLLNVLENMHILLIQIVLKIVQKDII